jgi:hypothetical protein
MGHPQDWRGRRAGLLGMYKCAGEGGCCEIMSIINALSEIQRRSSMSGADPVKAVLRELAEGPPCPLRP